MMRVEIAPAGTDPTKSRSTSNGGILPDVVQSNGLLIAGVVIFIIVGVLFVGKQESQTPRTVTPAPVSAPPPEYCEYEAILIREGQTVVIGGDVPGGRWVTCEDGQTQTIVVPISETTTIEAALP